MYYYLMLVTWVKCICWLQVVRCCLEHAASVARTFLTSDAVVVDVKEPAPVAAGNPMDNSGFIAFHSELNYILIIEELLTKLWSFITFRCYYDQVMVTNCYRARGYHLS